jgi:protein ImuB
MSRVACLWVPDLCLRAHVRLEPRLAREVLALVDGGVERGIVVAATVLAERAGIVPGMRVADVRVLCDAALIRPVSEESIASALATLADVAASGGTRVEIGDRGRVYLDCDGHRLLHASESALATMLAARADRQGFAIRIGIADSKIAAAAAARETAGIRIVPAGETAAFLAPLPIARLDPDPECAKRLALWGIRFIGDLARLPTGAVAHRLGPAGLALTRRARGEDDAPLAARPTPNAFEEALALDYGIDRLET